MLPIDVLTLEWINNPFMVMVLSLGKVRLMERPYLHTLKISLFLEDLYQRRSLKRYAKLWIKPHWQELL